MGERLRCGIIGTGSAGLGFINSIVHCPKACVVALAETNAPRARDISERYRIPRSYSDYQELIDQPDIDAIIVALPNYLHAKVAIESLKARKHVLLERPMALNAKEAAKILDTAKGLKRVFMVAQDLRFSRQTQIARQAIQRGDLGDLYHVRAFWFRRNYVPHIGTWHTQKEFAGGGCACDLGQNMLDLAFHLLGEFDAKSIAAEVAAKFGLRGPVESEKKRAPAGKAKTSEVEDFASAFIRMKSGRTVTLEVSWAGYPAPDERERGVDILGTNAGLSLFPARLFRPGPAGYDVTWLSSPKVPHTEDSLPHFVQCVLENKKPLVTAEESLAVQTALDALYASAKSRKEVRL